MGKAKQKVSNKNQKNKIPLDQQINDGKVVKSKNRQKIRLRDEETSIIDSKLSKKILSTARKQHLEMTKEEEIKNPFKKPLPKGTGATLQRNSMKLRRNIGTTIRSESDDDDDIDSILNIDNEPDVREQDFYDEMQINEEDAKAFELFQNSENGFNDTSGGNRRTKKLSDLIMEKIAEKETDIMTKLSDDGDSLQIEDIDPRVQEMYESVRDVMKRYRSGKVPKAFKIIPKLRNWEQILYITEPFNWSAAAMYQGTRTFCSVLSQNMAQRFYNLVLLPRVRDDLAEYKKLNVHLYNALRKALFKPAAFMKGIILPLLESGDCTLREAIIFGSVIAKNSIPVLHSSACLLKIYEMEYSPANSIFIRIFLDKRYALPYRVIDAGIAHFLRFEHMKSEMPVLWHQSLLTFVQRYKNDISSEQKDALFSLIRKQSHYKITPEIRRELQVTKCRDVEMIAPHQSDIEFQQQQNLQNNAISKNLNDYTMDEDVDPSEMN